MTQPDKGDDEEARARARGTWPVRRTSRDDEGRKELCAATTPEERIAMMDDLATEAWKLAGKPFPTYDRENIPIRRTTLDDA